MKGHLKWSTVSLKIFKHYLEYPTHQFRFHVKSKHKLNFNEYREKNGALEIQNRVYHRYIFIFRNTEKSQS